MTYRNMIKKLSIFSEKYPQFLDEQASIHVGSGNFFIANLSILDKETNPMFFGNGAFGEVPMQPDTVTL